LEIVCGPWITKLGPATVRPDIRSALKIGTILKGFSDQTENGIGRQIQYFILEITTEKSYWLYNKIAKYLTEMKIPHEAIHIVENWL